VVLGKGSRENEGGNREVTVVFLGVKKLPKFLRRELTTEERWKKILKDEPILPRCPKCRRVMRVKRLEYLTFLQLEHAIPPSSFYLFEGEMKMDISLICPVCRTYVKGRGKGLHVSEEGYWIDEIEVTKIGRESKS